MAELQTHKSKLTLTRERQSMKQTAGEKARAANPLTDCDKIESTASTG